MTPECPLQGHSLPRVALGKGQGAEPPPPYLLPALGKGAGQCEGKFKTLK